MFENNNIELKCEYTADIKKEVIAFANTDGGVIYIGKDNDGTSYTEQLAQKPSANWE